MFYVMLALLWFGACPDLSKHPFPFTTPLASRSPLSLFADPRDAVGYQLCINFLPSLFPSPFFVLFAPLLSGAVSGAVSVPSAAPTPESIPDVLAPAPDPSSLSFFSPWWASLSGCPALSLPLPFPVGLPVVGGLPILRRGGGGNTDGGCLPPPPPFSTSSSTPLRTSTLAPDSSTPPSISVASELSLGDPPTP